MTFERFSGYETSRYWMGGMATQLDSTRGSRLDTIKLATFQKAVANFVRITTGKDIPVRFTSTGIHSFTDGKTVVLSSKVEDGLFDVNVGLAIHEGSHILLSNFKILEKLMSGNLPDKKFPSYTKLITEFHTKAGILAPIAPMFMAIKDVFNIVEDRRIDNYIYTNAPGYRGYYTALYNHYFNDASIDKALKHKVKNVPNWDNYLFHLCNIMNPNIQLDTLPKLEKVAQLLNLPNIGRLRNSDDALKLALEITIFLQEELFDKIVHNKPQEQHKPQAGGNPNKDTKKDNDDNKSQSISQAQPGEDEDDDQESAPASKSESNKDEKSSKSSESKSKSDNDDADSDDSDETTTASGGSKSDEPSDEDSEGSDDSDDSSQSITEEDVEEILESLKEAIEEQKSFTEGKIEKNSVNSADIDELNAIASTNMSMIDVNDDSGIANKLYKGDKIKCLVVNELTTTLLENSSINPIVSGLLHPKARVNSFRKQCLDSNSDLTKALDGISSWATDYSGAYKAIVDGISMGRMLGKKLKLRNEANELNTTRLRQGKIDKRLIAEIGYGSEAVFSKLTTKTVNPISIHYSIDASGSMQGTKFNTALKSAAAIAKAASMITGVDVVISFRGVATVGSTTYPVMLIGYDSKKNPITHLTTLMSYVKAQNSTPEGLCFEAILKQMQKDIAGNREGIFINLSDGQPGFHGGTTSSGHSVPYIGKYAEEHTKKQVDAIRKMNYKILSYFVTGGYINPISNDAKVFKRMYGSDSQFINVTDLNQLAASLNKIILQPAYNNK